MTEVLSELPPPVRGQSATSGVAQPLSRVISVPRRPPGSDGDPPSLYGENTFLAVTTAYATLMGNHSAVMRPEFQ